MARGRSGAAAPGCAEVGRGPGWGSVGPHGTCGAQWAPYGGCVIDWGLCDWGPRGAAPAPALRTLGRRWGRFLPRGPAGSVRRGRDPWGVGPQPEPFGWASKPAGSPWRGRSPVRWGNPRGPAGRPTPAAPPQARPHPPASIPSPPASRHGAPPARRGCRRGPTAQGRAGRFPAPPCTLAEPGQVPLRVPPVPQRTLTSALLLLFSPVSPVFPVLQLTNRLFFYKRAARSLIEC